MDKNIKQTRCNNFIIYVIGLVVAAGLIGLSFLFSTNSSSNWSAIIGGAGASLVGSVFLGYFIERANNEREKTTIELFRKNQLNSILLKIGYVIERTAYWCFRISEDVIAMEDEKKCKRASYNDLWNIFEKMENIWEAEYLTGTPSIEMINRIECYIKNIQIQYENLIPYFDVLLGHIDLYEAYGYFTHQEIENIKSAYNFANDLTSISGRIALTAKDFFDSLTAVKEFEDLRTTEIFYYKKKILIKIKGEKWFSRGLTEEFIKDIEQTH